MAEIEHGGSQQRSVRKGGPRAQRGASSLYGSQAILASCSYLVSGSARRFLC
jgi:hypothetical protein